MDALERGYEQLEEARLAAAGAIETALKEDDEKKIKAMLAQIDAQKARLDADARKARAAWLARDFRGISAQVAPLREHAQEMGAYYTLLAGDFRGRAAKAADPKFGLTPNVGGGRRGLFGGIGANIPIGADKRKAGVFEGCAANLDHAAATARAAALRR
ncbi:MAG: hypothetical protein M5U26_18365 [Planctomycetota bacterium]|nr:hypothetical protein [Planctomycetota bacterium]